jgi:hypothetical protein
MGKAEYRIVGAAAVGTILFKGMAIEFVIDAADLSGVKEHRWHYASSAYIATSVTVTVDCSGVPTQKKRELYLHNFLLKPRPHEAVQHISKNGLDNRRANLRLVDIGTLNNQTKKRRNVELPIMCGIRPEDIPRHIWYVQANGYHRDRFAIEFKTEGILWKSTSSKNFSLKEKLEHAQEKLNELYEIYPHLDPKREEEEAKALEESFSLIVTTNPGPLNTSK